MSWYTIPKVKVRSIQNEKGAITGVLLKHTDFEKLVEKMEDFLDNDAVEQAKKEPAKFYTHEEIKKIIERKKR